MERILGQVHPLCLWSRASSFMLPHTLTLGGMSFLMPVATLGAVGLAFEGEMAPWSGLCVRLTCFIAACYRVNWGGVCVGGGVRVGCPFTGKPTIDKTTNASSITSPLAFKQTNYGLIDDIIKEVYANPK